MSNRTKTLLGLTCLVALLLICAPIYFYVKDFHQFSRSTNPSDWGTFGDYFGGILNPIISFFTLLVTIFIAVYINKIERRNHEEMVHTPVKPFFTIESSDFFSSDLSLIGPSLDEDFYDYTPPNAPTRPHDYFQKQFYLKVSNKGLGIANEVSVTFEFDLDKLKSRIVIDDPKLKITTTDIKVDEDGREALLSSTSIPITLDIKAL